MALPTSTNNVTVRKLSSTIDSLWTKVKAEDAKNIPKMSGTVTDYILVGDANGNATASNKKLSNLEPAITTLPLSKGGTGAQNAAGARTNLDVYSKSETDSLMNGKIVIVETLPTTGNAGKIYYLKVGTSATGDNYDEYIWGTEPGGSTSTWIKVGEHTLDLSGYKTVQTAVSDPSADGTGTTFIDSISQDANGVITPHKKTVQDGTMSQKGIVKLSSSTSSSSTSLAATSSAVKAAYDLANGKQDPITFEGTYDASTNKAATQSTVSDAINALDATKTSTDGTNVQVKVTEANGKVTAVNITTDNTENKNNKVSAFQSTPDDTHYPSEKLVKDSLDNKVDKVSGKGLSTNDFTTTLKNKLDGIASGAEVNQNAFSNVKVGSTTIAADSKTDTLTIVGDGATTVTPDATNDKLTISSTDQSVTDVDYHYTPEPDSSPDYSAAGGTATQLPTSSSGTLVQVVTGIERDAAGHVIGVKSKGLWSPDNNTTYTNAKLGQGYCSSSGSASSEIYAISLSGYTLSVGGIVAIKFSQAVAAGAKLNINGTAENGKPIYYGTSAISAGVIQQGDTATFVYDGTNYVLIGIDRSIAEMTDTEVTNLINALS